MHEVKAYGINGKEALTGDWEELNKDIDTYIVWLQNNVKVYFFKQIWINKLAYINLGATRNQRR